MTYISLLGIPSATTERAIEKIQYVKRLNERKRAESLELKILQPLEKSTRDNHNIDYNPRIRLKGNLPVLDS